MPQRRTIAALGLAAALTLALSACSDSSSSDAPAATTTATAPTSTASASDVAFAQSMIAHHQQAVQMADMAQDPETDASPEVQELATQIKAAQDPEIQQMTGWLQKWGQPTAMPGASSPADMQGMDHDIGGMTVSGMMSTEDMTTLDAMSGPAFDQMWLQMMVEHHEGAVAMAEQVATTTLDADVAALAEDIIKAQNTEIATMKDLQQ